MAKTNLFFIIIIGICLLLVFLWLNPNPFGQIGKQQDIPNNIFTDNSENMANNDDINHTKLTMPSEISGDYISNFDLDKSAASTIASDESKQIMELSKAFNQAESASDAEEIAWKMSEFNPDLAERQILELSNFCFMSSLGTQIDGLQEKNQAFCDDFIIKNTSFDLAPEEIILTDPLLAMEVEFERRLENNGEKQKTDVINQFILESIYPEQIDMLQGINHRYNYEYGENFWLLGVEIKNERFPAANLLEAQTTALTLFRCIRFGGCGRNHYYTAFYCATVMDGACKKEDTLEQMMFSITKPVDYALAQEILAELYNSR